MRVWLCEKKDQAINLAPLLGNPRPGRGYIDTNDGRVTWAMGHLLEQPEPEACNPAWEQWSFDVLPMIPETWQLVPCPTVPGKPDPQRQLAVVVDTLKLAAEVVIASDYGAEGEAIARELLEYAGFAGSIRRLKYSALDAASIQKALGALLDGRVSEPLYWASQARSRADWIVGMNLSRAYTIRSRAGGGKGVRSVGRVQSPTLALIVRRDREIESFTSRTFYDVEAVATTRTGESVTLRYTPPEAARIFDRAQAEALAQRLTGFAGPLRVEQTEKAKAPPKLLDLLGFTKATSKKLGWKGDHALKIAQSLYDKKLITYPRTDCTLLPNEHEPEITAVLDALAKVPPLARHVGALTAKPPQIRPSVFNTAKVNEHEHHAMRPTAVDPTSVELDADERAGYGLIAQHYLAALMPDYRFAETRISLDAGESVVLTTVGRVPLSQGWQTVFGADPDAEAPADGAQEPAGELPAIADGAHGTLGTAALKARKTTPPARYTDGTLQEDMASVAKYATDPAIKARLKETSGLGTPATRAEIVATLRKRGYIEDQGKFIVSTAIGRELVDALPPQITDPGMTALWEDRLVAMRRGELPSEARDEFVQKIAGNITKLVDAIRGQAAALAAARTPSEAQLRYARTIADALGVALPSGAETSFSVLTAFINEHGPTFAALPPSAAQLAFAEKVAAEKGIELPAEVRTNRSACGAFLDLHAPKAPRKATGAKGGAKKAPRKKKGAAA